VQTKAGDPGFMAIALQGRRTSESDGPDEGMELLHAHAPPVPSVARAGGPGTDPRVKPASSHRLATALRGRRGRTAGLYAAPAVRQQSGCV
jgi:hypothetical protein